MGWKFTLCFFDTFAAGKHGGQSTPFVNACQICTLSIWQWVVLNSEVAPALMVHFCC